MSFTTFIHSFIHLFIHLTYPGKNSSAVVFVVDIPNKIFYWIWRRGELADPLYCLPSELINNLEQMRMRTYKDGPNLSGGRQINQVVVTI